MIGEDLSSTDLYLTNGDTLLVGQVAERAQIRPDDVDVANHLHVRKLQVIMVALCNRADHYIFILFLLSSFFFFPRLISAVGDWMFTIPWHMVWP